MLRPPPHGLFVVNLSELALVFLPSSEDQDCGKSIDSQIYIIFVGLEP